MRHVKTLLGVLVLSLVLVACSFTSSKSYTYDIKDTKESILVSLDTQDGYNLKDNKGVFTVEKDGKTIISGTFLTEDMVKEYIVAIESSKDANIVKESEELLAWEVNDDNYEYDRIVAVKDAKTYVLMTSPQKPDKVDKVYDKLTFSLDSEDKD